jgi:dihydrolipoamide dehydrogenase
MFPSIEVDRKKVITSKEAMTLPEPPKSLIVIGAGPIGIEFSYFYNMFGSQVTVVEMQDRIVPIEDVEISKELERNYRKEKIRMLTSTRVLSAKATNDGVEVIVEKKDGSQETLIADLALNAVGVQANVENIGLENLGIEPKGFLKANADFSIAPNVYAIGDLIGGACLAHKASAEAIALVETLAGHSQQIDYTSIPGCTYGTPQVASVGLTEAKAIEQGYSVKIGKFPFTASGKAHAMGEAVGFVKLVFDEKTEELLGAHLIGPEVTELLGELCLAKSNKMTARQIIKTMHAHPTLSEAVMEAAAQAFGEAVNC